MIDKELLQTICNTRGHNEKYPFGRCFCGYYNTCLEENKSNYRHALEELLRGWLTEPETLKKWFGEEEVCSDCGEVFEVTHRVGGIQYDFPLYGCACGYDADPSKIIAYQYHGSQIVIRDLSVQETLTYYAEHKPK